MTLIPALQCTHDEATSLEYSENKENNYERFTDSLIRMPFSTGMFSLIRAMDNLCLKQYMTFNVLFRSIL